MGNVIVMMENLPTQRITSAIKFLAIENKMSQTKLAKASGMSQSAINRRLTGQTSLTIEDLNQLAQALGQEIRISFIPTDKEVRERAA